MNSIVISFGGLRVHYLGCYGGTWIETPAFDRFAAEGFVFDECFVETPGPAATRQSWWTGSYQNFRKPTEPQRRVSGHPSLIRTVRSAGIRTVLIRDSRALLENSPDVSAEFDQIIEIERADADSTDRVFEAARKWLNRESGKCRFLLVIDCHGAHPPWYPREPSHESEAALDEIEAEREVEGEDEVADAGVARESDSTADRARQNYAAVVSHLDSELGSFLDFVRARADWEQSLVLVTSDCGADLEEQHAANLGRNVLHEGRVHVPLLVRVPAGHDPASRSRALVQSIDLMPTVCDAYGFAIPRDVPGRSLLPIVRLQARSVRDDVLMADAAHGWSIRTPAWHLILPSPVIGSETPTEPQLFVKPDDRWDRNDVAKQYPQVVEQLQRALQSHIDEYNTQITNDKSQTSSSH